MSVFSGAENSYKMIECRTQVKTGSGTGDGTCHF